MKDIFTSFPFIIGAVYVFLLPVVVWGLARLQKWFMIDRVAQKTRNRADLENLPQPAWGIWIQRIKFTISDKRDVVLGKKDLGIARRVMFFVLYDAGFVVSVLGAIMGSWTIILVGFFMFFVSIIFAIKSSKELMSERDRIMSRMLEVGRARLGQPQSSVIGKDIKVLEWKDFTNPQKVQYTVPTTFSDTGADGFLQQFNQVFGSTQQWVPVEEEGGWDYDKGLVTLGAVPPLPTRADWSEHYVLADGVADSFFPLGLSVIGGVEIPNPETGEVEHVLGYDVGGKQMEAGAKAGLTVDGSLGAASPMSLFAGATGSGKSVSLVTPVLVYRSLE